MENTAAIFALVCEVIYNRSGELLHFYENRRHAE